VTSSVHGVEGNQGTGHREEPTQGPGEPVSAAEGDEDPGSATIRTRGRRFRQPWVRQLTQLELDDLPVDKRLELLLQRRQSRHQTLNSIGILFGVVFTAAGLIATALTLRTGQDELHNAQQSQITDRYTKALEQLASAKPEVRLGGIYALERLMTDSARDQSTILEVLASYIRVHAQDPPPVGSDRTRLAIDVQAALTVIGRRNLARANNGFRPDLTGVDFNGKDLRYTNLTRANLTDAHMDGTNLSRVNLTDAHLDNAHMQGASLPANLRGAHLTGANLSNADLIGVNLTNVDLAMTSSLNAAVMESADLNGKDLRGVDLQGAFMSQAHLINAHLENALLAGAHLDGAVLRSAHLQGADLTGAHLKHADLTGADMTKISLRGAHLQGADLRGMHGITAHIVRRTAETDATTKF
jgi:uncharacterized protein YjbI with pentapeptide repeats